MKLSIELITPKLADEYLARNTNNYRKINHANVKKYAEDMKEGKWEENAEPISFSPSGVLLNGQHRLAAIVKSGVSVNMVVARDVDAHIFDIQGKRTDSQYYRNLGIQGYSGTTAAGCLAGMVLANSMDFNAGKDISMASKGLYLRQNETEIDAVISATNTGTTTRLSAKGAVYCATWCLFLKGERIENLAEFFSVVNTGFPVAGKDCSSAIAFRNQLLKEKGEGKSRRCMENDFSSTIRAFTDFKSGISRRNVYSFDPKTAAYLQFAHLLAISKQ